MNARKRRVLLTPLLAACFAAVLSWPSALSAQCAMCRTALTNSEQGQRWAQGINAGILLLLIAPFLIFGAIFLRIYNHEVNAAVRQFLRHCRESVSRTASRLAPPLGFAGMHIRELPADRFRELKARGECMHGGETEGSTVRHQDL